MVKVISIIIMVLALVLCLYFIIRIYKKANSLNEKIILLMTNVIYLVPWVVYVFDKHEILTKLGYFKTTDSDRWFDFASNYISTIVGTIVSGLILLLMTRKQIKAQADSTIEDRRLSNLPLLKYDSKFIANIDAGSNNSIILPNSDCHETLSLALGVKNIGMNSTRDCYIWKIKYMNNKTWENPEAEGQNVIEKDNGKYQQIINFPIKGNSEKITIIIRFQDILSNWYEQEVSILIDSVFSIMANTMPPQGNIKLKVKKERLL